MVIECLRIQFKLEGCDSLKDKRKRLSGLKIKYGKRPELAVAETDFADSLTQAEWSFITLGQSNKHVDQTLQKLEKEIAETVDARIIEVERAQI